MTLFVLALCTLCVLLVILYALCFQMKKTYDVEPMDKYIASDSDEEDGVKLVKANSEDNLLQGIESC